MISKLIDFSRFTADRKSNIAIEAAKQYFINTVFPYIGETSLQRLAQANIAANRHLVKLEIMRIFIASELIKATNAEANELQLFFEIANVKEDLL